MRLAGGGARVIYLYLADHDVNFPRHPLQEIQTRSFNLNNEKQSFKEAARRIKTHFKLG
jgi:hypothetical protein